MTIVDKTGFQATVVEAAKLWLHTHPAAGPRYERAHSAATEQLMTAIRVLNRAESNLAAGNPLLGASDSVLAESLATATAEPGPSLSKLRDEAYENARAHGFHDVPRTVGDAMALLTTEIGEAYEAFRDGGAPAQVWYEEKVLAYRATGEPIVTGGKHLSVTVQHETPYPSLPGGDEDREHPYKPCGVPSEIADLIIRALDFSGEHGIDIERAVLEKMAYNKTRPFKHGGKAL